MKTFKLFSEKNLNICYIYLCIWRVHIWNSQMIVCRRWFLTSKVWSQGVKLR